MHRKKDSVKLYLREIGCENVDWIHLAEDTVMKLLVSEEAVNFLSS
jgi:hypothetical protein